VKYILRSLTILFASLICICSTARSTMVVSGDPNVHSLAADPKRSDADLDGIYFGISEHLGGDRAWLLTLHFGKGQGMLYMPPANLELAVKRSGNEVSFRSTRDLGDIVYVFEGQLLSTGLSGTFNINRQESTPEKIAHAYVTLKKVAPSKDDRGGGIRGLFSNVRYNEDSGDLTGTELIVFGQLHNLAAIFTSFEDDMVPYVARNLVQSPAGITFAVRTEAGEQRYTAQLVDRRLRLRRIDETRDARRSHVLLLKKKELAQIFR
jgi:hypothetical protein